MSTSHFKPLNSDPFDALATDIDAPEFDHLGDDLIEALETDPVVITPITDSTGAVNLSTFTDEDFQREHPIQVNGSKFMAKIVLRRTHFYRADPSDLWRLEWSWYANNTYYRFGLQPSFVIGTEETLAKYIDFDPKAHEYPMTASFFAWARDYPMAVEAIEPGMTNRIQTWEAFNYDIIGRLPTGIEGDEVQDLPGMTEAQARACFKIAKTRMLPAKTRHGREFTYPIVRAISEPMVLLK